MMASDSQDIAPLVLNVNDPTSKGSRKPFLGRFAFWRSPTDQPRWARPTLLVITALATLSYAIGIQNFPLEPFYAASARSMGSNWKDFFFGAVDPLGFTSLDKLPGAIWLQAISVRIFGFHYWAVALPQVILGSLTILVLYRAVRRCIGVKPAIVAAVILAASPVTILLNRGNVSDSALILLTVLAADATIAAIQNGELRKLLWMSLWIGLAFQTKMIQAWIMTPALFSAYLMASPVSLRRRCKQLGISALVIVVISLSWMSVVSSIPNHDRPFVDGTTNDSVYAQVFVYNGWSRIGIDLAANTAVTKAQPFLTERAKFNTEVGTFRIKSVPNRLLVGPLGRDDAWLMIPTVISLLAIFITRRNSPRTDLIRASGVMWGVWLVVLFVFFSAADKINSYYTAALIPAVAALCSTGLLIAWRTRETKTTRFALLFTVISTAAYCLLLIPNGIGASGWLVPSFVGLLALAILTLLWTFRASRLGICSWAVAASVMSLLIVPASTSGVVVGEGLGSFSTPYQPAAATIGTTVDPEAFQSQVEQYCTACIHPAIVAVLDSNAVASQYIMGTGEEYLGIGGYTGSNPSPTLSELKRLVAKYGQLNFSIPITPAGTDPRLAWIRKSCNVFSATPKREGVVFGVYNCAKAESQTAGINPA